MVIELIQKLKARDDEEALIAIINKFQNLLKFYSRKLKYEDAYEDLVLDLIKMVKGLDRELLIHLTETQLLLYIKNTIKNSYIQRSKHYFLQRSAVILECEMSENDFEKIPDTNKCGIVSDFSESLSVLTKKERTTIVLHFLYGYSINDIALKYNVSRMTINRWKKSGLVKLKSYYKPKEQSEI